MRIWVVGYFLIIMALTGCTTSHAKPSPTTITLIGAPITVDVPKGFVASDEDEVTTNPRRPMRHFHLPELPNGGTPGFPDIYIEQLNADEASITLDSYVNKAVAPSQYRSFPFPPKTMTIDGVRAIEFATTSEMIADFEGGGAGHADMIDYEIVFQYQGMNYHCVMETGADDYKKYVPVFEEFCSSVRFSTVTVNVPAEDIAQATKAFQDIGIKQPVLEIISKDEIHAYGKNRDLGWFTAKRTVFVEPDRSSHPGWYATSQGLPEDSKALDCIAHAQQVYVFPVAAPDDPHRDDAHMRLLEGEARSQLIDAFESDDAWERALDSMRSPPSPPGVGFMFKHGNDELVLFPWERLKTAGTFNGEHLGGLLTEETAQKLKDWEARYAKPELGEN